jgi:prophage regulatory protein
MTDRRKSTAPRGAAASSQPIRAAIAGSQDRLLKLDEVRQIAKLGKTMIYRLMKAGQFPLACKPIGSSSSRWSEREVIDWVEAQLAARAA